MDVTEAVAVITQERDRTSLRLLREAYDMAIIALQMQDGNLFLDSVNGSFKIGVVNGDVMMGT